MVAVTRAPKAPSYVEGMVNLRGRVIPVIDLRKRCDLRLKPYDLNTQLLIARTNQHAMALMVDVVSEVLTMPASSCVRRLRAWRASRSGSRGRGRGPCPMRLLR